MPTLSTTDTSTRIDAFRTEVRGSIQTPLTPERLAFWRTQLGLEGTSLSCDPCDPSPEATTRRQLALLEAAVPALAELSEREIGDISWLVTVSVGDTNVVGRMQTAPLSILQYALAAVLSMNANQRGRVAKLEQRIRARTKEAARATAAEATAH